MIQMWVCAVNKIKKKKNGMNEENIADIYFDTTTGGGGRGEISHQLPP